MHVCICIVRALIIPLPARRRRLCAIASAKIQSAKSHEAPKKCVCVSQCACLTPRPSAWHLLGPGPRGHGPGGPNCPGGGRFGASLRDCLKQTQAHAAFSPPLPFDFLQLRGSHSGRARGCDCARRCFFLPETETEEGERGREREREVRPPRLCCIQEQLWLLACAGVWRRKHVLHMKRALIGARTCPWARAPTSELPAPATNS